VAAEPAIKSSQAPISGTALAFEGIGKRYGTKTVLEDVVLPVAEGSLTVLYGPPASGKSVLMRILMGLEEPTSGRVTLRGQDVTHRTAGDRNIGYIPQSFALYPHFSVHDNIAYPLKLAHVPDREIAPIVQHAAEMLHIPDLLAKRPDQLSGGQKQRVAIARGLAKQSDIYVFDDPLAGLDFKLREQLVEDLRDLQREWRAAFLYTTSDAIEALTLADHLAVLAGGSIIEAGPPERLYADPQQRRTMALVGFPPANFLAGRLIHRNYALWCETALFSFKTTITPTDPAAAAPAVVVGLRPESLAIGDAATALPTGNSDPLIRFDARIVLREDLGGEEIIYLQSAGVGLIALDRRHGQEGLDTLVPVAVSARALFVFAEPSGRQIGRGATAPPTSHPLNGRGNE